MVSKFTSTIVKSFDILIAPLLQIEKNFDLKTSITPSHEHKVLLCVLTMAGAVMTLQAQLNACNERVMMHAQEEGR